jgi:predicted site-specific integrase-resolvase
MKSGNQTGSEPAEFDSTLVNKKTVARAASVSVRTIDNWIREKRIPFLRISKRCVRFRVRDVLRALDAFTVKEARR